MMIRVVFYSHALIALYCLLMALFDGMENRPFSLTPPPRIISGMAIAALILPCVNLFLAWRARVNAFWLFLAHVLVGGMQLFFGIMPLFV